MDKFGVPKKINRHVLRALYFLNDSGFENPQLSVICELVEHTMKNTVPVANLRRVVHESLHNMAQLGVIGNDGLHFFVQDSVCFQRPDIDIFKPNIRRNERNKLDPNSRKREASKDSLSGNEIEKVRKRIRGTKPINMKSEILEIPKAKEPQIISLSDKEEDSRAENDKSENDVHLGKTDQFISQPIEFTQDLHQAQDLKINDVIESSEQQQRSNSDDQQEDCEAIQTVTGDREVKTSDDQHVEVENNLKQEEDM